MKTHTTIKFLLFFLTSTVTAEETPEYLSPAYHPLDDWYSPLQSRRYPESTLYNINFTPAFQNTYFDPSHRIYNSQVDSFNPQAERFNPEYSNKEGGKEEKETVLEFLFLQGNAAEN